jgi:nucleoside-diphosphate-sugar epimerase
MSMSIAQTPGPAAQPATRLLILGCGYTGERALRLGASAGLEVFATVRSQQRADQLRDAPAQVLLLPQLDAAIEAHVDAHTHVIVCFPPDPETDVAVAPSLARAHSLAYVSSTGVYGERRGPIDDATPLPDPPDARAARILQAEQHYRRAGATVLRASAIYGPQRGLHMRVIRGEHRIPGDGSRMLSRIHVEDLARLALAAARARPDTFVVSDSAPAPHIEVVQFICRTYGVALPPSVPLDSVHASLRADRAVDASRAWRLLGLSARYPSYRDGMSPEATGIAPQTAPAK